MKKRQALKTRNTCEDRNNGPILDFNMFYSPKFDLFLGPDNNYARINGDTWETKWPRGIYTQYFGCQTSRNALSIVPLKKVTRNEPKVDWPPEVPSDQRAEALDSKGWPTIQGKRKPEVSLSRQLTWQGIPLPTGISPDGNDFTFKALKACFTI